MNTAASIPSGFARDTAFDDRLVWSSGTPGSYSVANDGSATHRHELYSHGHTANTHTHSITGALSTNCITGTYAILRGAFLVAGDNHAHAVATSTTATQTYSNATGYTDYAASKPPSYETIVIYPTQAGKQIPVEAIAFADTSSGSTGFDVCDGGTYNGHGTTDLDEYWLIGAPASSDPNGSVVGSSTHTHSTDTHYHGTPVLGGHTHTAASCGASSVVANTGDTGYTDNCIPSVHHTVPLNYGIGANSDTAAIGAAAGTSEANYTYLMPQMNTTAERLPLETIIMCTADWDDVPIEWQHCDGTGESTCDLSETFIKCTTDGGTIGDTGGSSDMGHTADPSSHTHTVTTTHTHTAGTITTFGSYATFLPSLTAVQVSDGHTHSWTIGNSVGGDLQSASPDLWEIGRTAYYQHREVLFIKLTPMRASLGSLANHARRVTVG